MFTWLKRTFNTTTLGCAAALFAAYMGWAQYKESTAARAELREQYLAEKAPRLKPIRLIEKSPHILLEIGNDGESDAREVSVAMGLTRPDGSSVSDWEPAHRLPQPLGKGETSSMPVADLALVASALGYAPSEFSEKRFAKPSTTTGVVHIAIDYSDIYGNRRRKLADFVAAP